MAINKSTSFSESHQELAAFGKAISHPARVVILKFIAEQNSCICGDIVEILPLAQSTVSQHLKELQQAGLIRGSIEGPKTCYCVDFENYERLTQKLRSFLDEISTINQVKYC